MLLRHIILSTYEPQKPTNMNKTIRLVLTAIFTITMSVGVSHAQNIYGDYGQDNAEDEAARVACCNARLMNDPDLAQAMSNISNDIFEAQEIAKNTEVKPANTKLATAKELADKAKKEHAKGQYCMAHDLIKDAYGAIADAYAELAADHAARLKTEISASAAEAVAIYAEASHNDGLDCAMAASRNAKLNNDIASGAKVRYLPRK